MFHWEELIRAFSAYSVIIATIVPAMVHQSEMTGLLSQLTVSMIIILGQIMQLYGALELPSQLLLQVLIPNQLGLPHLQWRFSSMG